jgi:hypothetical protein
MTKKFASYAIAYDYPYLKKYNEYRQWKFFIALSIRPFNNTVSKEDDDLLTVYLNDDCKDTIMILIHLKATPHFARKDMFQDFKNYFQEICRTKNI